MNSKEDKEDNEVLTKEMEVDPVKICRVGSSDRLTVPALFRRAFSFLRSQNVYFVPRVERTPEGRMLLIFEEVKP